MPFYHMAERMLRPNSGTVITEFTRNILDAEISLTRLMSNGSHD